ncbi:MAG: DUF6249 domain-containing protein [Fidelibacterota bacterium]|jgi:hypothetical protein
MDWAFIIPLGFFGLIGFMMYSGMQKEMHSRTLLHAEIMNAIDKGVDVPIVAPKKTLLDYLRRGVIFTVIGLCIGITFLFNGDFEAAAVLGSVPFAVGIGYLSYYKVASQQNEEK